MRFGFVKCILFIAILLSGCAGVPPETSQSGTVAKVRLGQEMELLNLPIKETKAVMDRDGHVHVLTVDSKSRDLHYLVIGPEGVTNREIVRSSVSYSHFDAVFDYAGHLHVVIDEDHLVREEGVWRAPQKGAPCLRLVRSGQDLVCAFIVSGEKVGSPGRWNWYGLPRITPWYSHPEKLVVARETPTGWSDWTVLDPDTKLHVVRNYANTRNFAITTNDLGTVHILYARRNATFFAPVRELAYAQLEPTAPRAGSESKASASGQAETPRAPAAVSGRNISSDVGHEMDMAADPESGTILIVASPVLELEPGDWKTFMVHHGRIDPPVPFLRDEGILKGFHDPHLAPAGRDRFHALVTWRALSIWVVSSESRIYYLTFSDGTWSTLVQLGKVKSQFLESQSQLVSDRLGHALAIWPNEDKKLVARWIELMQ